MGARRGLLRKRCCSKPDHEPYSVAEHIARPTVTRLTVGALCTEVHHVHRLCPSSLGGRVDCRATCTELSTVTGRDHRRPAVDPEVARLQDERLDRGARPVAHCPLRAHLTAPVTFHVIPGRTHALLPSPIDYQRRDCPKSRSTIDPRLGGVGPGGEGRLGRRARGALEVGCHKGGHTADTPRAVGGGRGAQGAGAASLVARRRLEAPRHARAAPVNPIGI
jgi:hypothetical protein